MTELLVAPPPPEVIAAMGAIPRMSMTPSILITQQGPGEDGQLGPEAAGAMLLLQATFANQEGATHFWEAAVELMALLAEAPGFIRRYSWPDGPTISLLALWRSAEDAHRFGSSPEHRAAVKGLYKGAWQHTHFSAIWEMTSNHGRVAFCDCGAATPVTDRVCSSCGDPLLDIFRTDPVSS